MQTFYRKAMIVYNYSFSPSICVTEVETEFINKRVIYLSKGDTI